MESKAGFSSSRCHVLPAGAHFQRRCGPVEVVVYGMTAAFGLEYLVATWGGLWREG